MIFTIKLKRLISNASIFYIIICKINFKYKFYLVVLLVIYIDFKLDFYYTILSLNLAIRLKIKHCE